MSKKTYDPTRPRFYHIAASLSFIASLFLVSWLSTLILGAIHTSVAAVPAFGYLDVVGLFWVGSGIVSVGTGTNAWHIEERIKKIGQVTIKRTPLAESLDTFKKAVADAKKSSAPKV